MVSAGDSPDAVVVDLLGKMGAADRELLTLYYGNGLTQDSVETPTPSKNTTNILKSKLIRVGSNITTIFFFGIELKKFKLQTPNFQSLISNL